MQPNSIEVPDLAGGSEAQGCAHGRATPGTPAVVAQISKAEKENGSVHARTATQTL